MSKQAIYTYYNEVDKIIQYGQSRNEQSVRLPFINLLNVYASTINNKGYLDRTLKQIKNKHTIFL